MAYCGKNVWIDDAFPYSGQTLHYSVYRNNTKIYEGEATARDYPIVIYLNRFAQDYLESHAPGQFEPGMYTDSGGSAVFSLVEMTYRGGEWVEGEVLYSAEYIDAWDGENFGDMAHTINGHADPRQKLLYSSCSEYGWDPFIYSASTEDSGDTIASPYQCTGNWVKLEGTVSPLGDTKSYLGGLIVVYKYEGDRAPNYYRTIDGTLYHIIGRRLIPKEWNRACERMEPVYGFPNVYKCNS